MSELLNKMHEPSGFRNLEGSAFDLPEVRRVVQEAPIEERMWVLLDWTLDLLYQLLQVDLKGDTEQVGKVARAVGKLTLVLNASFDMIDTINHDHHATCSCATKFKEMFSDDEVEAWINDVTAGNELATEVGEEMIELAGGIDALLQLGVEKRTEELSAAGSRIILRMMRERATSSVDPMVLFQAMPLAVEYVKGKLDRKPVTEDELLDELFGSN
jgi:hypothetical protein